MFLEIQTREEKEYYANMLSAVGSLSRLFSDSEEPYIAYRVAENLFCKAFKARNLSRGDTSADASKDRLGFGIKTFLRKNGKSLEKVAEFNKDHGLFSDLPDQEKIFKVAELRNERIEATKRIAGISNLIYHCVTREEGRILVFEEPMNLVQTEKIRGIRREENSVFFEDSLSEYKFSISKSTLYKRFVSDKALLDIPVKIIGDPFEVVEDIFKSNGSSSQFVNISLLQEEKVYLPLYSNRGEKHVPENSGLNQWNARGRARHPNEVYIPIPAWIHRSFPGFFPSRETPFSLHVPSGEILSAKVCQAGSKALMTNPNQDLGRWLLRDVLGLKEGELLTYDRLERIGLDSVVIYKTGEGDYGIDFTKVGAYESFEQEKGG